MSDPVAVGFYGKLPARGDFVRAGLPRDFTDRWDEWLQSVLAGSRALMGEAWLPAFLEAPVWRFALPAGMCGERAVLGLMLPSVDRAGRYFPLTFAALHGGLAETAEGDAWLDRCEAVGRDALEQDTPPQEISDMLGLPDLPNDREGRCRRRVVERRLAARESRPDDSRIPARCRDLCSDAGRGLDASGRTTWESTS